MNRRTAASLLVAVSSLAACGSGAGRTATRSNSTVGSPSSVGSRDDDLVNRTSDEHIVDEHTNDQHIYDEHLVDGDSGWGPRRPPPRGRSRRRRLLFARTFDDVSVFSVPAPSEGATMSMLTVAGDTIVGSTRLGWRSAFATGTSCSCTRPTGETTWPFISPSPTARRPASAIKVARTLGPTIGPVLWKIIARPSAEERGSTRESTPGRDVPVIPADVSIGSRSEQSRRARRQGAPRSAMPSASGSSRRSRTPRRSSALRDSRTPQTGEWGAAAVSGFTSGEGLPPNAELCRFRRTDTQGGGASFCARVGCCCRRRLSRGRPPAFGLVGYWRAMAMRRRSSGSM